MSVIFSLVKKNIIILLLFFSSSLIAKQETLPVYLTWQRDPSTTMTIQWLSLPEVTDGQIEYQKKENSRWIPAQGICSELPLKAPYNINVIELEGLEPNSEYRFKIKDNEYRFRTAPLTLSEPLRFIVGGDIYDKNIEQFQMMTKQAVSHNPQFFLFGGDLAYSGSKRLDDFDRWFTFLSILSEELKDESGCMIPFLVAIGNHDAMGKHEQGINKAPFFYSLFAMPGPQGYNVLRFQDYLTITILDTNHVNPVAGKQTEWLKQELQKQTTVLHRFAIYHVGAFPSTSQFRRPSANAIRRHWVPLFEKYGLHAAFENHDHAYKRTYPLIAESHVPGGVVYFGDGSWGVTPRVSKNAAWTTYLAKAESRSQFLQVDISQTSREFTAITENGEVIDYYEQPVE